jgi:SAM-dependent methyltransferase
MVTARRQQRRARRIQEAQRREIQQLLEDQEFARAAAANPAYARVGEWLHPPGHTLELGCGPGRFVALLAALGHDVVGVDPYEFPEWELLRHRPNVTLLAGVKAEKLPFEDSSFDHVACIGSLLYFDDPDKALDEIRRVVRSGGRVALRTVNSGNLYTRRTGRRLDPSSRHLYSLEELIALLEGHGFHPTDSFAFGFWPPIASDFWWYLTRTKLPIWVQSGLSRLLPAGRRVNNVVLASAVA